MVETMPKAKTEAIVLDNQVAKQTGSTGQLKPKPEPGQKKKPDLFGKHKLIKNNNLFLQQPWLD